MMLSVHNDWVNNSDKKTDDAKMSSFVRDLKEKHFDY